jgi:hypothetical protein
MSDRPMSPALYLLRLAAFVAVGLVLLGLMQELSRRYPVTASHQERLERIETAWEDADRIELLGLGNSHASRSIEPDLLPGRAHVLGLAWNDIFEVEHQIRVLAPSMPNLQTVLLVLSPTSFHWDNALGDREGLLNSRRMFYAERLSMPWKQGDLGNYIRSKMFWLIRSDNWYGVVAGLRGREPSRDETDELRTREFLEDHAEDRAAMFISTARLMIEDDPGLVDRAYAAAADMIASLQGDGIRVVLVTPPYHTSYLARMNLSGLRDENLELTARLVEEFGVAWIDATRLFAEVDQYFLDSDHLNERGRVAFTRWLNAHPAIAAHGRGIRGTTASQ